MKIELESYRDYFHKEENKFFDDCRKKLDFIPFDSNPSRCVYDRGSSLQSTVGLFIRFLSPNTSFTILESEEIFLNAIRNDLSSKVNENELEQLLSVIKDVFYIDGNLNIANISFFRYIPIVPTDDFSTEKEIKKYTAGQRAIASFLVSMYKGSELNLNLSNSSNLILEIVSNALAENTFTDSRNNNEEKKYFLPQYIKESFTEDLNWLLMQDEQIKVKYIHLLLHFYTCYAITQTLLLLSAKKDSPKDLEGPEKLYFILSSEKASKNHDAVQYGWAKKIQDKKILYKIYGKSQALNVANHILGMQAGFYPDVLIKLKETPFDSNRCVLEKILNTYEAEKKNYLIHRPSEKNKNINNSYDSTLSSYEEFLRKLEKLCVELQSEDYTRIARGINSIMRIRFLSSRRGNDVLILDDEMLFFLITLTTKGKKMMLEEMYNKFNSYGICFNRETRTAIEEFLLKMNLLDRKSDSGEVQYVRGVL